jgi:hypothetical protein
MHVDWSPIELLTTEVNVMVKATHAQATNEEAAYLFVDFSNLWYAVRAEATRRGDSEWAVRIHADNLWRILAGGRRVAGSMLVANREISQPVLDRFRAAFEVELVEAGCVTGTEQAGDELLQNAIYRTMFRAPAPGIIVLATGDGAGWREGRGFCETVRAARRNGFGVEIVSYEASLNRRLRAFANEVGAVIALDSFYESLTFLSGLRSVRPPSLIHRPTVQPSAWSARDDEAVMRLTEVTAA